MRDKILFSINGVQMSLTPSFETLSKLEQALGKSAVALLGKTDSTNFDLTVTDLAKAIFHCAKPEDAAQYPAWWSLPGVGQVILDQGMKHFVPLLIGFLVNAVSAKSQLAPENPSGGSTGN